MSSVSPFTSAQAPAPNPVVNMLAPDLALQQTQLARQQQLAAYLRQQALEPDDKTETIGGWAIQKSPYAGLSKMAQALAGNYLQDQNDQKQGELGTKQMDSMRSAFGLPAASKPGTPQQLADALSNQPSAEAGPQEPAAIPASPATTAPGQAASGATFPPLQGMTAQQTAMYAASNGFGEYQKKLADQLGKQADPLINRGYGINKWNPATQSYELDQGSLAGIKQVEEVKANTADRYHMEKVENSDGTTSYLRRPALSPVSQGIVPTPSQSPASALPVSATQPGSWAAQNPGVNPLKPQPGDSDKPRMYAEQLTAAQSRLSAAKTPEDQARATSDIQGIKGEMLKLQPEKFGQTPANKEEQLGYGKNLAEYQKTIDDQAGASTVVKARIAEMRELTKGFTSGTLTPYKEKLGGLLIGMGADTDAVNGKLGNISDMQAFNKEALNMAFDMTKQLTSRPAASEVLLALKANPNLAIQPGATQKIMDTIEGIADYKLAKQQAAQTWRNTHSKSIDGFESDWNSKEPITKYINIAALNSPDPKAAKTAAAAAPTKLKPNANGGFDYVSHK